MIRFNRFLNICFQSQITIENVYTVHIVLPIKIFKSCTTYIVEHLHFPIENSMQRLQNRINYSHMFTNQMLPTDFRFCSNWALNIVRYGYIMWVAQNADVLRTRMWVFCFNWCFCSPSLSSSSRSNLLGNGMFEAYYNPFQLAIGYIVICEWPMMTHR